MAFGAFVFMYSAFEINRERVAREAGLAKATTTKATPVTDCLPPPENGTSVAEDPDWAAQKATAHSICQQASTCLHHVDSMRGFVRRFGWPVNLTQ